MFRALPVTKFSIYAAAMALCLLLAGCGDSGSDDTDAVNPTEVNSAAARPIGFIGSSETEEELDTEAAAALSFARTQGEVRYIPLSSLGEGADVLSDVGAAWWHHTASQELPAQANTGPVREAMLSWIDAGGGLMLSGFAPQYAATLGLTPAPTQVVADPTIGGNWGIAQRQPHAIYTGLPGTFPIMSDGYPIANRLCWWNDPGAFNGRWLGDTEWSGGLVTVGEIERGKGRVIVVGMGAFEFDTGDAINLNRTYLERFTANTLAYLAGELELVKAKAAEPIADLRKHAGVVGMLSASATVDEMDEEQGVVHAWLKQQTNVKLIPLQRLKDEPGLIRDVDVLWWHEPELGIPDTMTDPRAVAVLRGYLEQGGGLLLSGFAATYSSDLGLEYAPATTQLFEPKASDAWGYMARIPSHPVFAGLGARFSTLSEGTKVDNRICWWDTPQRTRGVWLADAESGIDKLAMVEYELGGGRVIATGTGAFEWATPNDNANRGNLEQLTRNLLGYLAGSEDEPASDEASVAQVPKEQIENQSLAAHWPLEPDALATKSDDHLASYLHAPYFPSGVSGRALDFDGYSTYVVGDRSPLALDGSAMTTEAWVAIREYPTEFAAVVNQHTPDAGFALGLTRYGRLRGLTRIDGQWVEAVAEKPLPIGKWIHLAMTVDPGKGLTLYLDGEPLVTRSAPQGTIRFARDQHLLIGRDCRTGSIAGIFPTGHFNGLIDEVRIHGLALSSPTMNARAMPPEELGEPDLSVAYRYEGDPHRPVYHALPSHSWTNEPHGLIYHNGRYRLTYQANPAGPYWNFIRWGEMTSSDLVDWQIEPTLLRADENSHDRIGVWSGCAVADGDDLYYFYTGVNGSNASVSVAISRDGGPFVKHPNNPLIPSRPEGNFSDFRDPYIWRDADNEWQMVVGGGIPGVGGTLHHYTSDDLIAWEYKGEMFIGSEQNTGVFWEMPVFIPFGDRWLLNVSEVPGRNSYWVGRWDGKRFIPDDPEPTRLELINHFLSPTVTPDADGQYAAIGIIPESRNSAEQLKAGWAHLYGVPRRWTLSEEGRLHQSPHPNLTRYRGEDQTIEPTTLSAGKRVQLPCKNGKACEIEIDMAFGDARVVGLLVHASEDGQEQTRILYDTRRHSVILDRTKSSADGVGPPTSEQTRYGQVLMPEEGRVRLRVFVDHSVVECFVNDREVFSTRVYPSREDAEGIYLISEGGDARVEKATAWPMRGSLD